MCRDQATAFTGGPVAAGTLGGDVRDVQARSSEFYRRAGGEDAGRAPDRTQLHEPYTLLVAVVLSAQATDAGVNKATKDLFAGATRRTRWWRSARRGLKQHIRTIGLYQHQGEECDRAVAPARRAAWRRRCRADREALEALPGVGRKTANVVLNVAFGQPTIAVDTHIFRVANRTGLAPGKTPREGRSRRSRRCTPAKWKLHAHHWLILHGRYVCKARKPDCAACVVADLCHYPAKTGPAELVAARAERRGRGPDRSAAGPAPARRGAGRKRDQPAARAAAASAVSSPASPAGCDWMSPEIWPPHSISIWP